MTTDFDPQLLNAERVGNSVRVTFQDGQTAIYPAVLLYSAIELSEVMNEATPEQRMPSDVL